MTEQQTTKEDFVSQWEQHVEEIKRLKWSLESKEEREQLDRDVENLKQTVRKAAERRGIE